jgi:hypothetical protein
LDLLWLEAQDLRKVELIGRGRMLHKALKKAGPGLRFSEHLAGVDGEAMFRAACALGLEGIVAKKLMSRYKAVALDCGRTPRRFSLQVGLVHELGEGQESGLRAAQRRASARRRSRKAVMAPRRKWLAGILERGNISPDI